MTYQDIDARLDAIHTGLSNLQSDTDLNGPMDGAGYPTARISQLLALHDAAFAAHLQQKTEYAEQFGATEAYNTAWANAHTVYIRHVTLARVAFKKNMTRFVQLGLQGSRKESFSGWMSQARQFYHAAVSDPAIQADLTAVGISPAALLKAQALVHAADAAAHTQQKEKGEAQEATLARDALLDQLFEEWSDFVTIARVVFADDTQKLERMGIVVPADTGSAGGSIESGGEVIVPVPPV